MREKVLLGMSGGIDSAFSAMVLRERGYEVEGIYLIMHESGAKGVEEAGRCARELGINLHIKDVSDDFKEVVIKNFIESYVQARTPNPCVLCNHSIKFKALCIAADELGIEKIATGHYARIALKNGRYMIQKAKSKTKDQSYMLCRLPQNILARTLFPLSDFEKQDIRKIAKNKGFLFAEKKDSQDICFIPDGDYIKFISDNSGYEFVPGNFIAPDGKICGRHKGIACYTPGQRKGLNIALGERVYVEKIDAETNEIFLAKAENETNIKTVITLENIFPSDNKNIYSIDDPKVKIRYSSKEIQCSIKQNEQGGCVIILDGKFYPAPGQECVVYCGDYIEFCGTIKSASYNL